MPQRILYVDPFSGVAGDMFIGALLDLGLELPALHEALRPLALTHVHLSSRRVLKGGIAATKFDVDIRGVREKPLDLNDVELAATTPPPPAEHGHTHRSFASIRKMLEESALSPRIKERTLKVFWKLAEAEGKIHSQPPETVEFHEVGAIDSIVDITGVCAGLELLRIDTVFCGPLALGTGGYVNCAHGLLPVPAPATLEIVKGLPLRQTPVPKELTTPTGAALVAGLASQFGPLPPMTVQKIGYGAGTRDGQAVPNVLRVLLGEMDDGKPESTNSDTVVVIETNIDNADAELLGALQETLLARGALDVYCQPIQMKKNRPGVLLAVIAEPAKLDELAAVLFAEAPTWGLRYQMMPRLKLSRELITVQTRFGPVRVKTGRWKDQSTRPHPEFEDCRALAAQHQVPLWQVQDAALRAFAAR